MCINQWYSGWWFGTAVGSTPTSRCGRSLLSVEGMFPVVRKTLPWRTSRLTLVEGSRWSWRLGPCCWRCLCCCTARLGRLLRASRRCWRLSSHMFPHIQGLLAKRPREDGEAWGGQKPSATSGVACALPGSARVVRRALMSIMTFWVMGFASALKQVRAHLSAQPRMVALLLLVSVLSDWGKLRTQVLMPSFPVLCWVSLTQLGYIAKQHMWLNTLPMLTFGPLVRLILVTMIYSMPTLLRLQTLLCVG